MKPKQAAVTLRPAEYEDRSVLENLIAHCYAHIYPNWYDRPLLNEALPIMLKIDQKLLTSGHYFVANSNNIAVGCGGWSAENPQTKQSEARIGHIRHFATDPHYMGRGVGGAILNQCISEAKKSGITHLRCFSSLPAEKFYARYGFEKQRKVSIMLGESTPFPAIMMEKTLVYHA